MDLLLAMLVPLLISVLIMVTFAGLIFACRRATIKSEVRMILFLDRRFDTIRQKGFLGEEFDCIDAKLVRVLGNTGWAFVGLPMIILSLSGGEFFSFGYFFSFAILFFGGLFLGDSRAAVHFLRELNVSKYKMPNKGEKPTADRL